MNDRSRPEAAPVNTAGGHVRNDPHTTPRHALDATRPTCAHGIPAAAPCGRCPAGYAIPDVDPDERSPERTALAADPESGERGGSLAVDTYPAPLTLPGLATPAPNAGCAAETPGRPHPATSSRAYLNARAGTDISAAVLELIRSRPMTDDELVAAYHDAGHPTRTPQRIRSTRAELAKAGIVRAVGRRASALGNPASIWAVR